MCDNEVVTRLCLRLLRLLARREKEEGVRKLLHEAEAKIILAREMDEKVGPQNMASRRRARGRLPAPTRDVSFGQDDMLMEACSAIVVRRCETGVLRVHAALLKPRSVLSCFASGHRAGQDDAPHIRAVAEGLFHQQEQGGGRARAVLPRLDHEITRSRTGEQYRYFLA